MNFYEVENKNKSIFKIYTIYYISMVLLCVIRILSSLDIFPNSVLFDIFISIFVQVGILFLLPMSLFCWFFKAKPKRLFKDCNFEKTNIIVILLSFVMGILCFFINITVSSLFSGIISFTGYRSPFGGGNGSFSDWEFIKDIFLVCVLPGFCEEFIHRGILMQGIKHIGFKKAIILSALLFGLIHFNINQFSYAFVVGLILGFVAVVSKNIFPAMIMHFTNNFISTYLNYASNRGWFLGNVMGDVQKLLVGKKAMIVFVVSAVIMFVVIILLCLCVWGVYKQSIVKKVNKAINKVYTPSGEVVSNKPVVVEKDIVIRDLLESTTLLNLDYQELENPINVVLPKEKKRFKPKLKDNIFLYSSIILGALVTLFTYIWGLF